MVDIIIHINIVFRCQCDLGEFNISSYSLAPGNGLNWINAPLEATTDAIHLEPTTDPKGTYCSHIFHPGKFQRDVISKALVVGQMLTYNSSAYFRQSHALCTIN